MHLQIFHLSPDRVVHFFLVVLQAFFIYSESSALLRLWFVNAFSHLEVVSITVSYLIIGMCGMCSLHGIGGVCACTGRPEADIRLFSIAFHSIYGGTISPW